MLYIIFLSKKYIIMLNNARSHSCVTIMSLHDKNHTLMIMDHFLILQLVQLELDQTVGFVLSFCIKR
jgi:hypothetical protein